ncbi:hypothetical protein CYFUS_003688 [Cystobacter fuscus]|uniref:Lipoprotein n=1 Tax=Cystobacter fuscus TaxID=43 RepID=A0A250J2R9_9BACT|nr:hypothetical protein [Cystobacter fuscus]ATB38255.1 hypothetical protein CYFUS_003688 [Cystobacter fuscus]
MHGLGKIVIGMVTLFGSSALADLPPVKQASTVFQGCNYSIKSQPYEGVGPGGAILVYYKIILQREQGPYNLCWFPPATRELLDTGYEPELAITANFNGIVAAYGWTTFSRSTGLSTRISVQQLNPYSPNPDVLEVSRESTLVAYQFASPSSGGMPSSLFLDGLKLQSGNLEVRGRLAGNWVTAEEAPSSGPIELYEGGHFIALYPDIFNTVQRPLFVTY